jgi:hypothetical protein
MAWSVQWLPHKADPDKGHELTAYLGGLPGVGITYVFEPERYAALLTVDSGPPKKVHWETKLQQDRLTHVVLNRPLKMMTHGNTVAGQANPGNHLLILPELGARSVVWFLKAPWEHKEDPLPPVEEIALIDNAGLGAIGRISRVIPSNRQENPLPHVATH